MQHNRRTNYDNVISYVHIPSALNAGAKRSDVPYGHASMLLLGEGSDATEPDGKYANLFKYSSVLKYRNLIAENGKILCQIIS